MITQSAGHQGSLKFVQSKIVSRVALKEHVCLTSGNRHVQPQVDGCGSGKFPCKSCQRWLTAGSNNLRSATHRRSAEIWELMGPLRWFAPRTGRTWRECNLCCWRFITFLILLILDRNKPQKRYVMICWCSTGGVPHPQQQGLCLRGSWEIGPQSHHLNVWEHYELLSSDTSLIFLFPGLNLFPRELYTNKFRLRSQYRIPKDWGLVDMDRFGGCIVRGFTAKGALPWFVDQLPPSQRVGSLRGRSLERAERPHLLKTWIGLHSTSDKTILKHTWQKELANSHPKTRQMFLFLATENNHRFCPSQKSLLSGNSWKWLGTNGGSAARWQGGSCEVCATCSGGGGGWRCDQRCRWRMLEEWRIHQLWKTGFSFQNGRSLLPCGKRLVS